MTRRQNRTFVVLDLPTRVSDLIVMSRAVLAAGQNNPLLPKPRPSLATIEAAIVALENAEVNRLTNTRGTAPVRNEAESKLRAILRAHGSYVQEQADANPDVAQSLIASAGYRSRKASSRAKLPFTAKPGKISATADLEVKAPAKRAMYHWQWRVAGTTKYNRAPNTIQAKTTIPRLPIGQYVEFRFRVATKTGEGNWSESITVLVK
jgi:hypothetical protein